MALAPAIAVFFIPYLLGFLLGWNTFLVSFAAVASILIPIYILVKFLCCNFTITTRRVILTKKIGRSFEILLGKVEGVEVQQDLLGMMLGYGNVRVTGTGISDQVFGPMASPKRFRAVLQDQLANYDK